MSRMITAMALFALLMAEAATAAGPFPVSADRDSTLVQPAQAVSADSSRIGKKLGAGVLGGVGGGFAGGVIAVSVVIPAMQSRQEEDLGSEPSGFEAAFTFFLSVWGGYIGGTAAGVSWVDPQDNFLVTLGGSALMGVGVPVTMALIIEQASPRWEARGTLKTLSAMLAPVVGATIASELWRRPSSAKLHLKPAARRVSVGLVPNPKGGLSAVATLRF